MLEELKEKIINELNNNRNLNINYTIDGIPYVIIFMGCNKEIGINISSILAIPQIENINNQIVLESNNMESADFSEILEQGCQTGIKLARLTSKNPAPILIPLIPSSKDFAYFQQLSRDCFQLSSEDLNYRIDEQVKSIIEHAKNILMETYRIAVQDKIFVNGYSTSGIFAQRFALLHPKLIDTVCLGGASGSIPIPIEKIKYPMGIGDYEFLFGKKFDYKSYLAIKFRYYVGEFELKRKAEDRFDDYKNPVPMHDMSFFDRSTPIDIGKEYRVMYGQDMFERVDKIITFLKSIGLDIQHKVFFGRTHNDVNGHGVNEMGDAFFNKIYSENNEIKKMQNTK